MKKQFFIIDTSAILSGKPLNIHNAILVTTPGISEELTPGGKDYQTFELLKETGLQIQMPTKESIDLVKKTAKTTGDDRRISPADTEIIALAVDINKDPEAEAVILSDDYSIQNLSSVLQIRFEGFSQRGITKKFTWISRCPGCGKQFKKTTLVCPICGTTTSCSPKKKHTL